jgi:hypothetical protein
VLNSYIKYLLVILLYLIVVSCNNLITDTNLYGRWVGSYNDHELVLIIKNDNSCVLRFYNEQSNNLETLNGTFELDYKKKPIPFSIRNIPQLNHQLHTIIEFIEDDSIKIAKFSSKWRLRPISFDAGNTINLKRLNE